MHQHIAGGRRLMNEVARPSAAAAPRKPIAFAPAQVRRTTDSGGIIRLASSSPLGAYDPSLARLVRTAVEAQPARTFLQERTADGWRHLHYEEARANADALAAALIE